MVKRLQLRSSKVVDERNLQVVSPTVHSFFSKSSKATFTSSGVEDLESFGDPNFPFMANWNLVLSSKPLSSTSCKEFRNMKKEGKEEKKKSTSIVLQLLYVICLASS